MTNNNNNNNPLEYGNDDDVKLDLKLEIRKSNPNGFLRVLVVIVVLK